MNSWDILHELHFSYVVIFAIEKAVRSNSQKKWNTVLSMLFYLFFLLIGFLVE